MLTFYQLVINWNKNEWLTWKGLVKKGNSTQDGDMCINGPYGPDGTHNEAAVYEPPHVEKKNDMSLLLSSKVQIYRNLQ